MKRIRTLPTADPEHLTTPELLALHERIFGPLTPQAKARMLRPLSPDRTPQSWDGMDGLAA